MENSYGNYTTECAGAQGVPFKIDPEFQNKIPPIGEDEFKQLRENILTAGEVYEPLVVWDGTLVDGHNRWKVIQENPTIKWRTREMQFADKWAAFEWMYKNQLGRRNLTDEQRTYSIGMMYKMRKRTAGGDRRSEEFSNTQNGNLKKQGTAGEIARELHIGNNTVVRAEKFVNGIDALREVNPEAADKVLSGKAPVTKTEIQGIAKSTPDEVHAIADKIMNPPKKEQKQDKHGRKNIGRPKEYRELREVVDRVIASQTNPGASEVFDIEDLIREIEVNGESYVKGLRSTLAPRTDMFADAEVRIRIFKAIGGIIQDITKVRGEYLK